MVLVTGVLAAALSIVTFETLNDSERLKTLAVVGGIVGVGFAAMVVALSLRSAWRNRAALPAKP